MAASYRQAICSANHTGALCLRCIDTQAPRFGSCTSCPPTKASAALAWLATKVYEVFLVAAFLATLYVIAQRRDVLSDGLKVPAASGRHQWVELHAYVLVSKAVCAALRMQLSLCVLHQVVIIGAGAQRKQSCEVVLPWILKGLSAEAAYD